MDSFKINGQDGEFTGCLLPTRSRLSMFNGALHNILVGSDTTLSMISQAGEVVAEHFGAELVLIWIFNPQKNILELQSSAGPLGGRSNPKKIIALGKATIGLLAQERRRFATNGLHDDPILGDVRAIAGPEISAFIHMPLEIGDKLLGSLAILSSRPFSGLDLEIAVLGTERVSLGLDRQMTMSALSEALQHSQDASQLKSEFVAHMSHEIRTPLNGVIATTELLLKSKLGPMQQELARTTLSSAETLLAMVSSILDQSKISAGRLSHKPAPFDLQQASEKVAEMLFARAYEKGLELVVRYAPNIPRYLIGDEEHIQQVLRNLVSNAIKFSHNGYVVINVECEDHGLRDVKLRIEVADTGVGIAKKDLKRIFEGFTQVDSSGTRQYEGTGLGLAISRDLVRFMGGEIGVNSQRGEGSTFWFTLRLPIDLERPAANPLPLDCLKGVRALLVIHNKMSCRVVGEILSSRGVRSTVCTAFHEVLPALRDAEATGCPFQVAVLDRDMPGIHCDVLGRAIKSDATLCSTALVILTSGSQAWAASPRRRSNDPIPDVSHTSVFKPVRELLLLQALMDALAVTDEKPGSGKTRVNLPSDHSETTLLPTIQHGDRQNIRVLVVEDNAINQKVASLILKPLGIDVDIAANGREALRMTKTQQYDLIFMDCQMPEMDGFEATRRIRRRNGPNQHGPIIAMTANAMQKDRERCLAAGMDDLIAKPIRQRDLVPLLDGLSPALREIDPIIDSAAFLSLIAGDAEFLPGFVDLFLTEFSRLLAAIRVAAGTNDYEVIRRSAHELKGINLSIHAYRVVSAAERLETKGANEDLTGIEEAFESLEHELNLVTTALINLVQQHAPSAPA